MAGQELGGDVWWLTCVHPGAAVGSGGKGAEKDKDAESGGDAGAAGAPGEILAGLGSCVGIACKSPMRPADSGQWLARWRSSGPFKGALAFLGIILANRSPGRKRRGWGDDDTGSSLRLPPPPTPPPAFGVQRAESEGGDADRVQEPWNFSEK